MIDITEQEFQEVVSCNPQYFSKIIMFEQEMKKQGYTLRYVFDLDYGLNIVAKHPSEIEIERKFYFESGIW